MDRPSHDEAILQALPSMSMTEMIRLQDFISRELRRRFEKRMALAFSDVVGSTDHFARFGDESGRRLQQRHFDLLTDAVVPYSGRIVDTAGDGAFIVFPETQAAVEALITFEKARAADNANRTHDQQLDVRMAIHYGLVLTDGVHVTGDAVNLAARVTGSASPGEIRLTRDALLEISPARRLLCRALGPTELKGFARPIDVFRLDWQEDGAFPDRLRLHETGEMIELPRQETIRFGRLDEHEGLPANDIVLRLRDTHATLKISRWHFELRRRPSGYSLRPVSDQLTEVNGRAVPRGTEVPVKAGTVIRVSQVLTLELIGKPGPSIPTENAQE
jgi:class 3 adenylate cyclase